MTDRSKGQPFDERTALDALEQFQSEIKRYRRERRAVTNDFEEFVRTFPPADDVFPTEKPAAPIPASPEPSVRPLPTGAVPPEDRSHTRTVGPVPPEGGSATRTGRPVPPDARSRPATKPVAAPRALETPQPARSKAPLLAALLVIALVVAAVTLWNTRPGEPAGNATASAPATDTAPPPQPAGPAPAAPAPTEPPSAPAPVTGSEITTIRPVWVRVIADGERVVERELAAGAKITFTAEKTIVIRAGDAGAVRLVIRGEDQGVVGADGAVVTRTFTVPETQKTPEEPR